MISRVDIESTDVGEKKYYLVTPEGLIFHEIPFEEIHNLTREVWVSTCPCCGGIEGKYFAKERHLQDKSYHLNLYAVDDNGDEILMTKDHIMPRSKGGIDDISNYQTMCKLCNEAKGNKLED